MRTADERRRLDELPLARHQDLPPGDARVLHPADDDQGDDDVLQPKTNDRVDRQRQQDERERELDVGQAHQDQIQPAPEVPGQHPDRNADHRGQEDRHEADRQRDTRPKQHPVEDVPAELIGAEEVVGRQRRLEAGPEIGVVDRIGHQQRRQHRCEDDDG